MQQLCLARPRQRSARSRCFCAQDATDRCARLCISSAQHTCELLADPAVIFKKRMPRLSGAWHSLARHHKRGRTGPGAFTSMPFAINREQAAGSSRLIASKISCAGPLLSTAPPTRARPRAARGLAITSDRSSRVRNKFTNEYASRAVTAHKSPHARVRLYTHGSLWREECCTCVEPTLPAPAATLREHSLACKMYIGQGVSDSVRDTQARALACC
jgi:hypothetical protein